MELRRKIHNFLLRKTYRLLCLIVTTFGKGLPAAVITANQQGNTFQCHLTCQDTASKTVENVAWWVMWPNRAIQKLSNVNVRSHRIIRVTPGKTKMFSADWLAEKIQDIGTSPRPSHVYAEITLVSGECLRSNDVAIDWSMIPLPDSTPQKMNRKVRHGGGRMDLKKVASKAWWIIVLIVTFPICMLIDQLFCYWFTGVQPTLRQSLVALFREWKKDYDGI